MDHDEETGLCTLGTKVGTLSTQFSRNQFELLTQKFLSSADVPDNVSLGVREAARLHSNTGGQGFFKCSCQTKCQSKRCKCNKDGVKCNSRCHKNCSCHNHDNILIWIEYWNQPPFPVFSLSLLFWCIRLAAFDIWLQLWSKHIKTIVFATFTFPFNGNLDCFNRDV